MKLLLLIITISIISCSKSNNENNRTPSTASAPKLTITPGNAITISYNGTVTFSWTTDGTGVTVNGSAYPGGTFTSSPLQSNTSFIVTSYSPDFATNHLSTSITVVVTVTQNSNPVDVY